MRNRDDRPWREHHTHVPREFDQASRRADFRARGAHENDDGTFGHDPRWPDAGPRAPAEADAPGPVGRQGYPAGEGPPRRRRGAPQVQPRTGDGQHSASSRAGALAATSGYDDYEAEALFGGQFQDGDWPRTFRRGTRGSAVRPDHRGKGPQGYRRSDERLLEDVHQRLTDDAYLDARRVRVSVDEGVVVLKGSVAQRWMKHHAEHVAARCYGVVDVDNRIRVQGDAADGGDAPAADG